MEEYLETTNCKECKKSSKCFQKLVPSELEFINLNKKQITYKRGENICKQGAYTSYIMYLVDGMVKLYIESPGNKNINIKLLKTSEFIGLSSIYGENVCTYSSIAIKDSTICLIEKDSFKKLLNDNGHFATEIIKWHCSLEIQLFEKIKSLGNKQMHGRLADILLYLDNGAFKDEDVFSYITRKDIAQFACISTESVVRLLTELKNENIIELDGKKIKVIQPNLLKEISWRG